LVLVLVLVAGVGGLAFLRCESAAPTVKTSGALAVGREARTFQVELADEGTGLRDAKVSIVTPRQGETVLVERSFPGSFLGGAATKPSHETLEVAVDPKALSLEEGDAALQVRVRDFSWHGFFAGNETVATLPLVVDLKPPRVALENGQTYLQRGGAGLAVYSLNEDTTRDGVDVAGHFYPGRPFPGSNPAQRRRAAFFAIPHDAPPEPSIRVVAEDAAGNRTAQAWSTFLKERKFPPVELNLPPNFFAIKVRELAEARGIDTGDLVAAFQKINKEGRAEDEKRIRTKLGTTSPERLWSGPFDQLRNSKVTSEFAEQRSYFSQGTQISTATHFGYDLAVTVASPVTASNAGRVVAAEDLGIYGNCVLLDHGLGLTSLYGHLSRIDVNVGDLVQKGQTIGLSGSTGLAGGDHLHFAILVDDTYVDPVEWWDAKWIREKIDALLGAGPAAPAAAAATPAPAPTAKTRKRSAAVGANARP
jgi:murein DD-endopeptidase MepM/ murein hydrolase activator NlpD